MDSGLETLRLEIPPASLSRLESVRRSAIERGLIAPSDKTPVPARVAFGTQDLEAELRIKGDWTDHLAGPQWSLRIRLVNGAFHGMREFSIEAPATRNYLWEWLVFRSGQREGLIAPRATFVDVVQNGCDLGIYFLEEHFTKELLESQGRREGPIVAWDESTLWNAFLREGSLPSKGQLGLLSAVSDVAESLDAAEVRGYDERRTRTDPALARSFAAALDALKGLRALVLEDLPETPRMRTLQAQAERRGRRLDELVDVDRLARAHALLSVFQAVHPLTWHNLRFYYDPLAARLEPILFDNMAGLTAVRTPIPWRSAGITATFARDRAYADGVFLQLERMLAPGWLEGLFAELMPELAHFERALRTRGALPPGFGTSDMRRRLHAQLAALRALCVPEDLVGIEAERIGDELMLSAWSVSRAPVLIEGLRTAGGGLLSARGHLQRPNPEARPLGEGVILPSDGSPIAFRFGPAAALDNLEAPRLAVRALAASKAETRAIDLRPRVRADGEGSAPLACGEEMQAPAVGLAVLLERHPFLRHDAGAGTLRVLPGAWDVLTELVIPAELPLVVGAGTTLRFAPGVGLHSDAPLEFRGRERHPIELLPTETLPGDGAGWQGIRVHAASGRSNWDHVRVASAGVDFGRSPATFRNCRFEGGAGLTLHGADFSLEGVVFAGARAAGLAGEALTATLTGCNFRDGAHGLALWRSTVLVRESLFSNLTGEAMAFDDGTRARIEGGSLAGITRGVAARGASEVELSDLELRGVRDHAFLALRGQQEEEATLRARDVRIEGGAQNLAETGCTLTINGTRAAARAVDLVTSRGTQTPPRER